MDGFRRPSSPQDSAPTPNQTSASTPVSAPTPMATPKGGSPFAGGVNPAVRPGSTGPAAPQPIEQQTPSLPSRQKKSKKKVIIWSAVGFFGLLFIALGGLFAWYNVQLSAVDAADTSVKVVAIESGSAPATIAQKLEDEGVIRSSTVFLWYTRIQGVQNSLQAGAYRLSPSESTPEIVEHLTSGRVETFNVTLYPGATLTDNSNKDESKKYDVTTALRRAGYTDEEITAGLQADYSDYDATLFRGRPAGADLEGYVYGETYNVSADATVEDVLRTSFDHFWKVIEENGLEAKYEAQGLNLYQGITLASIIQRESGGDDKETIAQVFFTRYREGGVLGSDVTYQYITDKLGVPRDINYDSPYNTRINPGLPPGPIASPGEASLIAVGSPASTDYRYFLSGDDDVTYFARTYEEHQANIRNHCQEKCQII